MKRGTVFALALLASAVVGCGPDSELDDSEFETELEGAGAAAPDVTGQTTPPIVPPPPGEPLEEDSSEVILEQ